MVVYCVRVFCSFYATAMQAFVGEGEDPKANFIKIVYYMGVLMSVDDDESIKKKEEFYNESLSM